MPIATRHTRPTQRATPISRPPTNWLTEPCLCFARVGAARLAQTCHRLPVVHTLACGGIKMPTQEYRTKSNRPPSPNAGGELQHLDREHAHKTAARNVSRWFCGSPHPRSSEQLRREVTPWRRTETTLKHGRRVARPGKVGATHHRINTM